MSDIIKITDLSAPELDVYSRLNESQLFHYYEPEPGIFIAESPKVITRALDSGCEPLSMLLEEKHLTGEAKPLLERCGNIPVYTASFDVLTKLTGFQLVRGVLCAMRRPASTGLSQICKNARRIAILDNVVNPTNVGAIFRSAAALNMDGILLTPGCSDPLYRRSARVSMGTVFQIPWTYLDPKTSAWPQPAIQNLRDFGFKTVAMALTESSVSINHPDLLAEEKLAIILGNEGDGLEEDTISYCDYTVRIPMRRGVDSLNVAAASAVAFWQLGNPTSMEGEVL